MENQLQQIKEKSVTELTDIKGLNELESFRVAYLGKNGELTAVLKQMGKLSPEERPKMGQKVNEVKSFLEEKIETLKASLEEQALTQRFSSEVIDVTIPGEKHSIGKKHPLSIVHDDICDIFTSLGFSIESGPEVEYNYYNFDALNIPPEHPARDTQDTFYINDKMALRSQTSSVQIRVMEKQKPPIRIIAPGRVYRSDEVDATHSPLFHQIEGLVVDKGITMADLKGMLEIFIKSLYGDDIKVRFRPHHFPFTEPSAEVDVSCFACNGKGCRICKNEGYIEVLGAGMVHPDVLKNCGIDPAVYSGFAFGMGLERLVMRRYKIDDIRLFYENDMRFLNQF